MSYFETFKKYWYIVVGMAVVATLLGLIISIFQPPKYRSSVDILVIQKHGPGVPPIVAAQSAEAVAKVLTKVAYTTPFLDDVLKAGFDIKKEFPEHPEEKIKEWRRTIDVRLTDITGIVKISAYDKDRYQAEQIALAVAYVFSTKGKQYHGGGEAIVIKMIETPITTDKPAVPNIPRNVALGFVVGLIAGLAIVYVIKPPEEKIEQARPIVEEKRVGLPEPPTKLTEEIELKATTIPVPPPKPKVPKEFPKIPPPPKPKVTEKEPYSLEKVDRWIKTGKFE